MSNDQAYSEPWHSQNISFKHFQGCLGIFRGIDAYSVTLTGAKLKGKGEAFPALFENRKRVLILERKVVIVSTFGLSFPFKIKF